MVTHPEEIVDIQNNTAKKVYYSYKDSNRGDIEGVKIAVEKNGKYYILDFRAQTQKFDKYLPTVSKMIESFEILELNSFEDVSQGIRLNYLPDWNVTKEETYSDATYVDGYNIIFSPIKSNSSLFKENFKVFVSKPFLENSIAIEDYKNTINYFKSLKYPKFKLIESKSTILTNIRQPVYNITYSYGDFDFGRIISSNLITIQNDRLYSISYTVSKKNTTNIPTISAMIDTIEFFNLRYFSNSDLGMIFKYPSNVDITDVYIGEYYKKITLSIPSDYYDFSFSPATLTFEVYNSTNPNDKLNDDMYILKKKLF